MGAFTPIMPDTDALAPYETFVRGHYDVFDDVCSQQDTPLGNGMQHKGFCVGLLKVADGAVVP